MVESEATRLPVQCFWVTNQQQPMALKKLSASIWLHLLLKRFSTSDILILNDVWKAKIFTKPSATKNNLNKVDFAVNLLNLRQIRLSTLSDTLKSINHPYFSQSRMYIFTANARVCVEKDIFQFWTRSGHDFITLLHLVPEIRMFFCEIFNKN